VQAGGEVYSRACARCHAASDDPSAAATVVGLSDGQIAALAAFLQRHTVAAPLRRERPRAML
jgi:cytochrome c553